MYSLNFKRSKSLKAATIVLLCWVLHKEQRSERKKYQSLRGTRVENCFHLEAEGSVDRHTHSTEKQQMAVGDSEHHPEEGTTEERERNKQQASLIRFSCHYTAVTITVIY